MQEQLEQAGSQEQWWSIQQLAEHVGVSESFIRKLVRGRNIPFTRVGSKLLRFNRANINLWLASRGSGGNNSPHFKTDYPKNNGR